jgi:hypothetical protein
MSRRSASRTHRILLLGVLLAAAAGATAVAASQAVTSQNLTSWNAAAALCSSPQTVTASVSRDSYVLQSAGSSNFGTSSDLFVQSKSGSSNRRTLLAFTLPSAPAGCSLTAATLRLWQTAGVSGRTIDVYRAAASWTEGGVTWNNHPAVAGTAVGAASSSSSGWRTWNVLVHTEALYSGTNTGFVVRDRTENDPNSPEQKYSSREGVSDPQLVLTFG